MFRRIGFLASVLLLAALIVVPVAVAQDGGVVTVAPDESVMLGVATVLSGEGLVPIGEDIQRGIELAITDRPTVTVGDAEFAVALDVQDDQCSTEGGQAVANRFAADAQIVAIVGLTCSSAVRGAGPILDEAGYTAVSASATAVDLTDPETGFASFNRTTPTDKHQGAVAAEFIFNELGFTKIATLHDGSPYGEGLVARVTEVFEELGGEVVFADAVNVGDTDFRSLLEDIAAEEPELIYFGGFPAEAARLAQQRADAGLEDVTFMGADGIFTSEFINLAGDAAEGVYGSNPTPPASDAVAEFETRYEEVYGLEPTSGYHGYAYDATNLVLDAIEAVGEVDADGNLVVDRAALSEWIRSAGSDEPIEGLTGSLVCDGNGDCATGGIGLYQVQDGEFVLVTTDTEMAEA